MGSGQGGPPRGRRRNRRASLLQASPNKIKQNSLVLLGFIWFYLVESGLIKGLRPKKLKKFPSPQFRVPGCASYAYSAYVLKSLSQPAALAGAGFVE
jgi:hypothetical protein